MRSLRRIYYGIIQRIKKLRYSLRKNNICVLTFHDVYDEKTDDANLNISTERFKEFIERLKNRNVNFVGINEVLSGDTKKKCVVTFDDSFEGAVLNAVPILQKLNIPYTLFVSPSLTGKKEYITSEQIERLRNDPLCTIAFHTKNHKYMRFLEIAEVQEEIDCKEFEERYGIKCDYFAFPYGSVYTCSRKNINAVENSKYKAAFSTIFGFASAKSIKKDGYFIPRIGVSDNSYKKVLKKVERCFGKPCSDSETEKSDRLKIIASTALLSPYRQNWFEELAKYADVSVYYLYGKDKERDDRWFSDLKNSKVKYVFMKGAKLWKLGKISGDFRKEIKKNRYDVIILDGYGFFNQLLNVRFLNKRKLKYFVNADGYVNPEIGNSFKDRIKKRMMNYMPYFLCGSLSGKEYLMNCGVGEDRIFNHVFTSLYASDIFADVENSESKALLRKELGIVEPHVVISVGRFTYLNGYGKGYDAVLRAAKRLPKDVGWYIVGGEPTEEFAKMTAENGLTSVHYVDFMGKEELKNYYRAADVFVLMTVGDVWGLVVNEAMACGLPIITTDKCVAGRELVENGKNGFVIGVGDDEALAGCVKEIVYNEKKIADMGENSLKTIKNCTIEEMAKIHMGVFGKIKDAE